MYAKIYSCKKRKAGLTYINSRVKGKKMIDFENEIMKIAVITIK